MHRALNRLPLILLVLVASLLPIRVSGATGSARRINHLVVLYLENWSFDGLFGRFPHANGIANAGSALMQRHLDGTPYDSLPQVGDYTRDPPAYDQRFPTFLPVLPFDCALFVPPDEITESPTHRFYQQIYQIDGGRMDRFIAWGDTGALPLSYYDVTPTLLGRLAAQYTLCDNFFASAFGGSWLNHMWLISARTPTWPEAPESERIILDDHGNLVKDGVVTPDGFAVNDIFTLGAFPEQTTPTIGDRLSDRGVSWAYYAQSWRAFLAGNPDPLFALEHVPFAYFARYAPGTPGALSHLKDESDFYADLRRGHLPSVAFVKPTDAYDLHPGEGTLDRGLAEIARVTRAFQQSRYWADGALVITFDEYGGRWDHVPPPTIDRWGPGVRVPTLVVSPFARRHFVDRTQLETASILRFIEDRWHVAPLTDRDATAQSIASALR
jgi:phospholipase C